MPLMSRCGISLLSISFSRPPSRPNFLYRFLRRSSHISSTHTPTFPSPSSSSPSGTTSSTPFTTVLVRDVPNSFVNCLREDNSAKIDVSAARREHAAYISALAANPAVNRIVHIPADEGCPDCVFVEDAAVVFGQRAVIAWSAAASRRAEVGAVAKALRSLNIPTLELRTEAEATAFALAQSGGEPQGKGSATDAALQSAEASQTAPHGPPSIPTLDGGDVLIADEHMFVGLSHRTNLAAVEFLRKAFFPTSSFLISSPSSHATPKSSSSVVTEMPRFIRGIPVHGALHLKSLATWAGKEVGFIVADTPGGHLVAAHLRGHYTSHKINILEHPQCSSSSSPSAASNPSSSPPSPPPSPSHQSDASSACPPMTFVPDMVAANVLRVGNVIYYAAHCPASAAAFHALSERTKTIHPHVSFVGLHTPEINKADGAITCCSILVSGK